jgi:AcrR family transcriptional regulator
VTLEVRRGRPAGVDAEETRARIMAVATEHIADVGYANATMKAIAERARLTSAAIYHHFPSKLDLAVRISEGHVHLAIERLGAATDREGTLAERFVALLDEALALVGEHPAMTRFAGSLLAEAQHHREFAAVFVRKRAWEEALYSRLVRDAVTSGELSADVNVQTLVDTFTSITAGLTELSTVVSPERHAAAIRAMETVLATADFGSLNTSLVGASRSRT